MAFRDGNETAKLRRNVLLVMVVVVLALGYFFAWVPLHKSTPVAQPDPQLMTAPSPIPTQPAPHKTGKAADPAAAPDKDLKPKFNLH